MTEPATVKLDKLDFQILKELKMNSRRSIRQFAKALNHSASTVYNRINRLESLGIVKKWTVAVDYSLLNLDVVFYVFISVECEGCQDSDLKLSSYEICERLKKIEGICEISLITGDFDILVKLRTNSMYTTSEIIIDQIRSIHGVKKIVSNNCYETIHQECDVDDISFQSEIGRISSYNQHYDDTKDEKEPVNMFDELH
ncbi:MAG: Lrp/AsnC family transcriptional regulator [Candidatus Kariarchaeaceae archaeon]|jgi:DNA-binding Lrp family transcriptional regulator